LFASQHVHCSQLIRSDQLSHLIPLHHYAHLLYPAYLIVLIQSLIQQMSFIVHDSVQQSTHTPDQQACSLHASTHPVVCAARLLLSRTLLLSRILLLSSSTHLSISLSMHGGGLTTYSGGAHPAGKPVYFTKRSIVYQLPFSVVIESKPW